MRIAILGAGFTGLSAAYYLTKLGHSVTVFEKDSTPGGLAIGYKEKGWDWSLESHYHHWFTNDNSVLELAREINHPVVIKRPKTSVLVQGSIYQLDSPTQLLKFPLLSLIERIRMGFGLALLRYNPFWQPLEKLKASVVLPKLMGQKGYELLWYPQLKNKFGSFVSEMSLAWFWARIKKRTSSLAYPEGGFMSFAQNLESRIKDQGGNFYFKTEITQIHSDESGIILKFARGDSEERSQNTPAGKLLRPRKDSEIPSWQDPGQTTFDKVIVTLPSYLFLKVTPQLPESYKNKFSKLKGLGAINLVIRLKESLLKDGTYWLSVCDKDSPVMAVVEHTNFMDKSHYNNEVIVYLGNYLPSGHPYFSLTDEQLLKKFDPFLKKLNPDYKSSLIAYRSFKAPFAQPIIPINYSKLIPNMITPLENIYLANIEMVYPWDRGTNYAVEMGKLVSSIVNNE